MESRNFQRKNGQSGLPKVTNQWTTRNSVFHFAGTATDKTYGNALGGLTIKVFGEEGPGHPPIAMTRTDEFGKYEIKISRSTLRQRPRGSDQKFFLQVFNKAGHLIKSTARHIELSEDTKARVDIRLLNSEVKGEVSPVLCGFGNERRLSASAAKLSAQQLIEAFTNFYEGGDTFQLSQDQQTLVQILSQAEETQVCGEGYYSSLEALLQRKGQHRLLQQFRQAFRNYPYKSFKEFVTKNFRLLFRTKGKGGVDPYVPTADSRLEMPNGEFVGYIRSNVANLPGNSEVPPLYVQQVALIAEHALERFISTPFNMRNPIKTGQLMEIWIQRMGAAGAADPKTDHLLIRNRNNLQQNFATVPHELFHSVQYQYNRTSDSSGLYGVMREGGAGFIEDSFNDNYNRYVYRSQEILSDPAQSLLTPPESCDTKIGYAAALFWKYIAEQHSRNISCTDEPHVGIDTYHEVLLSTATAATGQHRPYQVEALRKAVEQMSRRGKFDQFQYLDAGQTETSSSETTWGNYLIANYMHSVDSPPPGERRFRYIEDHDIVTWPFTLPTLPTLVAKLASIPLIIRPENEIVMGRQNSISRSLMGELPYAARYYRITPSTSAPPRSLQISVNAFGGMSDPLIQILSFGPNGVLTDISKSDRPSYTKTINMTDLSSVVVIVASRMNAGDYTIRFEEVPGGPDPMITRWNSATRTEYEVNPYDYPWTQSSPDLIIDNNDDQQPDAAVVPGVNNSLKIRLHNRGNAKANGITVRLSYQADPAQLASNAWQPVLNASGEEQTVSEVALAAAGDNWFTVNWAPPGTSSSKLCVKAIIESPRDLNADNNTAIGCFIRAGSPPTSVARP